MPVNQLWLSNIAPEATDEDIKALIEKYAPGIPCTGIVRVPGDGSRPGAMLSFDIQQIDDMLTISNRINGMFWRGRTLTCTKMI